jgi:anti-sigma B factor antagonist
VAIGVRITGDAAVFDVAGEDLTRPRFSDPSLHGLVQTELEKGTRKILVNFEKAAFVDSSGIGQIIGSYTSTRNLGGAFKFCSVPQNILAVFMIVGIVPLVIETYPDEASARASFAKPVSQ